jgi:hypothetical protein
MDIGSTSWFLAVVIGALLLGLGIAYGLWQWSNRPRDGETVRRRDKAVKDLYDRPPQD